VKQKPPEYPRAKGSLLMNAVPYIYKRKNAREWVKLRNIASRHYQNLGAKPSRTALVDGQRDDRGLLERSEVAATVTVEVTGELPRPLLLPFPPRDNLVNS
jgi:hypothetical protein